MTNVLFIMGESLAFCITKAVTEKIFKLACVMNTVLIWG